MHVLIDTYESMFITTTSAVQEKKFWYRSCYNRNNDTFFISIHKLDGKNSYMVRFLIDGDSDDDDDDDGAHTEMAKYI